jgi:hypothetical protein
MKEWRGCGVSGNFTVKSNSTYYSMETVQIVTKNLNVTGIRADFDENP